MNNPLDGQAFLFLWIGFLLLMGSGVGACFLWGIRNGQFSRQDRARYLALKAEIRDSLPPKGCEGGEAPPEQEAGRREEAGRDSGRGAP